MNGLMDKWIYRQTDGQMDGWTDRWPYRWIDGWVDEWMNLTLVMSLKTPPVF